MTGIGAQQRWALALGCSIGLLVVTDGNAAGLRINTDQMASVVAGDSGSFTIRVANDGPLALSDLRIRAPADIQISCATATAAGRGFALGGELLVGDIATCQGRAVTPDLRPRSIGLTATARDSSGLAQVRHASFTGFGIRATPAQGAVVLMAGVIHGDSDSDGQLDVGENLNYHYTVLNLGSVALSALAVSDLSGSVSCPQTTLAVGANMVCNRVYAVTAGNASNGFVVNDVRVVGSDTMGLPVQGGDVVATLNLAGTASIRVFKSPLLLDDVDGSGFASVGDRLRYTFVLKNGNAQALSAVGLVEPDPTRIDTPIVCAASSLAGAPFAGNGTGALAANDVVLCNAEYTVRVSDENMGQALNLVEARANAQVAGPIIATGASAVVVPGGFLISVAKTVNLNVVFPGGTVIYTVTLSNPGTLPVANVTINDPLPAGVAAFSWTCAGASCPHPSGVGAIVETIPSFPAGAQIIYTVTATIADDPPGTVINIVSVTPPTVVNCLPDNRPPPCQSSVPINVVPLPNPVPVASTWSLLLLALTLSGLAALRLRRD